MDRSKVVQQRSQTALDRGRGQRRDIGPGTLDLREDAAARGQPRAAARTSDVDA
jgi:hypothetical protein